MDRMIWQYWETRGKKPAYVDGLYEIARKNAGVPIVRVTPETIGSYLPDIPAEILEIQELAHKADMIRVLLVQKYGGMWLDADAVVLRDLNPFFHHLDSREFVGFNDVKPPAQGIHKVRNNCFISRPGGWIVSEWARLQHAKFPRTTYEWNEVGSDIIHELCLQRPDLARILPFELICPVPWYETERFSSPGFKTRELANILETCSVVMMSNSVLNKRGASIVDQTVAEIAAEPSLLGHIVRGAIERNYAAPTLLGRLFRRVTG